MSEFPNWPAGNKRFVRTHKHVISTEPITRTRTAQTDRRNRSQLWKDVTDVKDYNLLIIDNLCRTPVDYLIENWLNDFYDTRMNAEVRAARLRRTISELEKRYKGTGRESINWQFLKALRHQVLVMYSLQAETDKLIKAQPKPDGSSGHLSDISVKVFHELTEDMIRQATIIQANRKRDYKRAKNTTIPDQRVTRPRMDIPPGGPPRGGEPLGQQGRQGRGRPIGQAADTPAPRGPRSCLHRGINPLPHAFSKCPNKGESNRQSQKLKQHSNLNPAISTSWPFARDG
ncbi:hypothetical protein SARC_04544 [Sphaeroforma arctica JP610]|uniref:Uncharacterized protein n=1 Tax=Sphaeroforma arctica JP610 TaxID=667725 RepID=A0A0L0G311_9EUKA|nr:hypothetical protein SARC_04544 [Sphaeroforma arctica JP610]KNC83216.1 hypothetical protein SARC_04544 [Sphaeroforma arctica JP610]|eukprot:XP_014157118.1 hypothetical protein SARC_04544 [Sphaeroforma arctica JP610]